MFYFSTSIDNILIEMIWETRAEILDARQTAVLFLELKVCESKKLDSQKQNPRIRSEKKRQDCDTRWDDKIIKLRV